MLRREVHCSPVLLIATPPGELTAQGGVNLFSAQASVLQQRFGYVAN